jgi:hypothetical protein
MIRQFISATIAMGAIGKTSLVIAEALAIATDRALLGIRPDESCRVWLWNGEDPQIELQRKVTAAMMHHGIDHSAVDGRLYLDSGREQPITIAKHQKGELVIAEPLEAALIEQISSLDIGLMIVDPFVSCHAVPENDNGAIDAVAKTWGRIADRTGCAIDLVHHIRKTSAEEATVDDARGAIALINAARSTRVLNRMSEKQAKEAEVENRRLYFRIDAADKSNLVVPAESAEWRRFVSVELGNGDSVGVVTRWEYPSAFRDMEAGDLLRVQQAIAAGDWRESSQAKDWAGRAVADVLGLDLDSEPARSRVKAMLKKWIENDALKVVKRKDKGRKGRPYVEVAEWACDEAPIGRRAA